MELNHSIEVSALKPFTNAKARLPRMLKNSASHVLSSAIFFLVRLTTGIKADPSRYHINIPEATYSPWRADRPFQAYYKRCKDNTMLDEFKMYELWHLVGEVAHLQGDLLEVGVWKGGSGSMIAAKCQNASMQGTVWLCDTFSGLVKAGAHDPAFKGGEYSDASEDGVKSFIRSLGLLNVKILSGIFPDHTGRLLEDKNFIFCHIDVDTYQSAKAVAEWVWAKLVVGGVIVYDDYGNLSTPGVTRLVEEQFLSHDRIVIHNLNGHAVVVKTSREADPQTHGVEAMPKTIISPMYSGTDTSARWLPRRNRSGRATL